MTKILTKTPTVSVLELFDLDFLSSLRSPEPGGASRMAPPSSCEHGLRQAYRLALLLSNSVCHASRVCTVQPLAVGAVTRSRQTWREIEFWLMAKPRDGQSLPLRAVSDDPLMSPGLVEDRVEGLGVWSGRSLSSRAARVG